MRNWLKNLALRYLLRTVKEDEFLRYDEKTKKLMVGKDVLPDADARMIISEAETLKNMYLYRLLKNELTNILNQKIFDEANDFDNIWFHKGGLYFLDIYDKKVVNLSEMEYPIEEKKEAKKEIA